MPHPDQCSRLRKRRASGAFSSGMSAGGAVRRGESTRSLEEAAASQPGAQRQRRVAPGAAAHALRISDSIVVFVMCNAFIDFFSLLTPACFAGHFDRVPSHTDSSRIRRCAPGSDSFAGAKCMNTHDKKNGAEGCSLGCCVGCSMGYDRSQRVRRWRSFHTALPSLFPIPSPLSPIPYP